MPSRERAGDMSDAGGGEQAQARAFLRPELAAAGDHSGGASTSGSSSKHSENEAPPGARGVLQLPRRKLLLLAALAAVTLCTSAVQSCIAPFFPKVATAKGLRQSHVGIVFGCFSLACLLYAPLSARLLARFGARRALACSAAVYAGSAACFGLAASVDSSGWFLAASVLCRCAESVGSVGVDTAALCVCARRLPHNVNFATSVVISSFGMGFAVGPPLGGLLYERVGYAAAFGALGAAMLLVALLAAALVEPADGGDECDDPSAGSMFALLKRRHFAFLFAFGSVAIGVPGIYRPTLEIHLRPYNLSPTAVGLMFMIVQIQIIIWSPIVGILADRYDCPRLLVIVGQCLCAAGFMLFGPSPLLPISGSLWLNAAALAVYGAGVAPTWSLTCGVWLDTARHCGIDVAKTGAAGVVSAALMAMFHTGMLAGTTAGSAAVDWLGYEWTTTGVAALLAAATICFGLHTSYLHRQSMEKRCENAADCEA